RRILALGHEGQRLAVALAHDDHGAALAGLVHDEATVASVLLVVRRFDVAAEIGAVDFYLTLDRAADIFGADCLADFVREDEGRLVLAIKVARELQRAMALGAVCEDR